MILVRYEERINEILRRIYDSVKGNYDDMWEEIWDDDDDDEGQLTQSEEFNQIEDRNDDLMDIVREQIDNFVAYEIRDPDYEALTKFLDPLLVLSRYVDEYGSFPTLSNDNEQRTIQLQDIVAFKILYDIFFEMYTELPSNPVDIETILEFLKFIDDE